MDGDDTYLIWSNEHRGWWRPGCHGYTQSLAAAGHYTRKGALSICTEAIPGTAMRLGILPELPVRLSDVKEMQARHEQLMTMPEPWK